MSEKIAAALLVLLLALAWFFRFDLQVAGAGGQGAATSGYMLNRWTGTAYFLNPSSVRELRHDAPIPAPVVDLEK